VVTDPEVAPNLCRPGGEETAKEVARITGKQMGSVEPIVAAVRCSRVQGKVHVKYSYIGYGTCSAANLAFSGPMECQYGCVGFGECAESCPFDAITMVDNFPVIDENTCMGCGTCVSVCPKGILTLVPRNARVIIRCSTKDSAKETRAVCEVGCIHCKACVRKCPAEAISEVHGVITIDQKKCLEYGPECNEVCIDACKRGILQPFHPRAEKEKVAA